MLMFILRLIQHKRTWVLWEGEGGVALKNHLLLVSTWVSSYSISSLVFCLNCIICKLCTSYSRLQRSTWCYISVPIYCTCWGPLAVDRPDVWSVPARTSIKREPVNTRRAHLIWLDESPALRKRNVTGVALLLVDSRCCSDQYSRKMCREGTVYDDIRWLQEERLVFW